MIFSPLSPLLRLPAVRGLTRDGLLALDPEVAHAATIAALRLGLAPRQDAPDPPELAAELCGLKLANPVGMAAGFDKNGEVPQALARMGFGLVEVGTVTPLPQAGNPRPRLFRIAAAHGVVNRMGFNNDGHAAVHRRLEGLALGAALGVNIGANKQSPDFVADYVLGVRRFADLASYLTVNISSPNTPGLRDLQAGEALTRLLGAVLEERARAKRRVPVFLKLAPDLDESAMDAIAAVIAATDLDGLIVSNTTVSRDAVAGLPHADEAGGLSGRPLFALSTRRLAQMRQRVGTLPIIGVGGIHSAESALAKFEAGANAVQLYSALVFGGLDLLDRIKQGLAAAVRRAGVPGIGELTGTKLDDWAPGPGELSAGTPRHRASPYRPPAPRTPAHRAAAARAPR
jgi:dihydroorotate dehydrogenase